MRFILITLIALGGLLFPQFAQAQLTIADLMGPPYNASTANIAQIVLDNLNPMMDTNPNFSDFSSSNDPYGAEPHRDDKGRGVKAEEAAAMSQMGILDAQGKATVLSVTGILLQTTSLVPIPGGFGLMLDPEKVEAGSILRQFGEQEAQQLAAMTGAYQKNYAQQQLLRNDFDGSSGSTSTVGFANEGVLSAPQDTQLPASVGSLGLYDALGVDAAAAQAALNSGNAAGFQSLLEAGVANSGFTADPNNSSGSITTDFLDSIGVSPESFFARSGITASDRGGGLRVEGTDEKSEDPFFLEKRQDVTAGQLGVIYGANQDNAGRFGSGPAAFAGDVVEENTDPYADSGAPTKRIGIRGREVAAVSPSGIRRDLDEEKLNAMGIVRPLPGTTIFDVARSTYKTWKQYRLNLYLARSDD